MKKGAPTCMKCYSRMCRVENGKACRRRVDERIERDALASFAESQRTAVPVVYEPAGPTPEMIARFARAEDEQRVRS